MNKYLLVTMLSVVFVFSAIVANAQGGPPPQGGATSGPIDGGAVALLLGAAVYGYKRLKVKEVTEEN